MKRRVVRMILAATALLMIDSAWCLAAQNSESSRAAIDQYCISCHNDRLKTAGLSFEKLDFTNVAASADIWEKAVRKLRVGMMPPQGARQPDDATRQSLVSWLITELDRAAGGSPNPGHPLLHRLNRVEYGNAIRDLLGLEVDPAVLLPPFHRPGQYRVHGRSGHRQRTCRRRSRYRAGQRHVSHSTGCVAGYPSRRYADRHGWRHAGEGDSSARW